MPGKQLQTFTLELLGFSSVWIIVCMSFERYFAVSRPLTASQICTTQRARWVNDHVGRSDDHFVDLGFNFHVYDFHLD